MEKQGIFESCLGNKCPHSCCGGPVLEEYDILPQEILKKLKKLGVNFYNKHYSNCLLPSGCAFEELNTKEDFRPLRCKIFPLEKIEITDSDSNIIIVVLYPSKYCLSIDIIKNDQNFINTAIEIVKKYYKRIFNIKIEIIFDPNAERLKNMSTALPCNIAPNIEYYV